MRRAMYERMLRRFVVSVVLASAVGVIATASPTSAAVTHGIILEKGCESPTAIGQPYECSYTIIQPVSGDVATISSLSDNVAAAGLTPPGVSSGNILSQLSL